MAIRNPTELPAVIAGNVPLERLSEALPRAGLVGRHDVDRGVLVIEPAGIGPPVTPLDRARRLASLGRMAPLGI
jgi:hypothetical protein